MNTKQKVDNLWDLMRGSINAAYAESERQAKTYSITQQAESNGASCLCDYAENISWSDSTARLLGRESANERQHRSNRPSVPGFSVEIAAKLILMSQISAGSKLDAMPNATEFLVFRQTAAEARLIGYLIREFVSDEWRTAVESLDYADLMKA